MCNKRPLRQPASESYCGSTQREPYHPFNHGRAEKPGGYSPPSLFVLASTPLWDSSDKIHLEAGRQLVAPRGCLEQRGSVCSASAQPHKSLCQSPVTAPV